MNQMQEYLTTKELADLLRIKERKVYDLAASGEVPCTKAMGKLLFPRQAIEAWLTAHSSGDQTAPAVAQTPPPMVFLGSHDPVLEWALREARSGVAAYFDSSLDGLRRMLNGEGAATGLHLYDPDADAWNTSAVARECAGRPFVLVEWAKRRRGLILAEGRAEAVNSLSNLNGQRMAARQPEAGAQRLFEHLRERSGGAEQIEIALEARSETDAAMAVATGKADFCFGLETVARSYRLDFAPIIEERFDLLVDRRAWFEPPLQALWNFSRSEAFQRHAEGTSGYDFSGLGRVWWNGP